MKPASNSLVIKALYWFFSIGFYLHSAATVLLILLNHLTYWDGWKYTIRGNLSLREDNWRPMAVNIMDNSAKPIFLMYKGGFARFDYSNISRGLTINNLTITFLDIAILMVSLAITFQLMKIFSSLIKNQVFDWKNIVRLRWIGLFIIIIPVLKYGKNFMFFREAKERINIPGHEIFSYGIGNSFYLMVLLALMVFTLTEIFKYGLGLQRENDLTV
ncbi:MAG: DUF2975 domain-containing protein [Sphingobacteriales bacterium]|nr:MAG: DUF2975 domain-containing protein [Sphingobacteriales bacterium]